MNPLIQTTRWLPYIKCGMRNAPRKNLSLYNERIKRKQQCPGREREGAFLVKNNIFTIPLGRSIARLAGGISVCGG